MFSNAAFVLRAVFLEKKNINSVKKKLSLLQKGPRLFQEIKKFQ